MIEQTTISFELVSPERKLVSEPVFHAVIPGVEGEMGVGPMHSSFVVALKPGVVKLYMSKDDKSPRKIFIAGGFADVTGDHCTVLAEQAVNVNEINTAEIEQQIRDLTEDLGIAVEKADKDRITNRLQIAQAKLQAAA